MTFAAIVGLQIAACSTKEALAFQEANPSCAFGTDAANVEGGGLRVVPTFHSLGVYWSPAGLSSDKSAHVLFGEADSGELLRRSLDLVYSAEEPEYRGSIVHLRSGTQYELTLVLDGVEQETIVAETWCEQFPVAETRYLPTGGLQSEAFVISGVHGSPDGYIVYTADPNGSDVLDGELVDHNVVIEDSSYVILRGVTLRNAQQDAILLMESAGTVHDIVIENNTIEGWGAVNPDNGYGEENFAIGTEQGSQGDNFERLIIQRNVIRNPRGDTNNWQEYRADGWNCEPDKTQCHPKGPRPVYLIQTAGNHAIRYNEITSSNGNYFMDAIGGGWNQNLIGNVHRDTDVYGNIVTHVWDDAIETEGGNVNIRIWGNYIDKAYIAIANSPTTRGPAYIFRNIVYRTQYTPNHSFQSGLFIKAKLSDLDVGVGTFVLHNTTYRKDGVGGVSHGIQGWGTQLAYFLSRNNVVDAGNTFLSSEEVQSKGKGNKDKEDLNPTNDFDHDLYRGIIDEIDGQEANGIEGAATYGNDSSRPYALAEGTLGHDDGIVVPNFSVGALVAPDMGAQEYGAAPLEFGVLAYPVVAENGPNEAPTAAFAVACTDLACDFTDQSSDTDGTVASWSWDFGDGSGSSEQSPAHGYAAGGSYTVTLTVTDDQGAASAPVSQSVTVSGPNEAPTADDQSVTTEEDTSVAITLTGSDPDGDPLTFSVADPPAHGSLSGSAPDLTYTPNTGYSGADVFTFTANDGVAESAPATVSITVTPGDEELTVTGVSPDSATAPATLQVVIDGTGFGDDAQVSLAGGEGPTPGITNLIVQSSTTIAVSIEIKRGGPPRPRQWDVTVTSGGASAALVAGFTVLP